MIRIFIAVLLYLIGLFTQAQERSEQKDEQIIEAKSTENNVLIHKQDNKDAAYGTLYVSEEIFSIKTDFQDDKIQVEKDGLVVAFDPIIKPLEAGQPIHNMNNYASPRFNNAKFVMSDKELTFEIQL